MISVSCFIVTNPLLLDLRGFSMTPGSNQTIYPGTVDVRHNGNPKATRKHLGLAEYHLSSRPSPPRKSHSRPQPMTR